MQYLGNRKCTVPELSMMIYNPNVKVSVVIQVSLVRCGKRDQVWKEREKKLKFTSKIYK